MDSDTSDNYYHIELTCPDIHTFCLDIILTHTDNFYLLFQELHIANFCT